MVRTLLYVFSGELHGCMTDTYCYGMHGVYMCMDIDRPCWPMREREYEI